MRSKLELVLGIVLLAVSFAGIPADWKVWSTVGAGSLLAIIGIIGVSADGRGRRSADASFVDGGPAVPTDAPHA